MARSSTLPFPRTEFGEARSHLMPTEMMAINRSSTATALVSGLAAMLMTILSSDTGMAWHPAARHGRHEQINKIRNAARNTADRKYAQVWDLFDEYTRDSHLKGESDVLWKMVGWILSKAKQSSMSMPLRRNARMQ
jgi:hypothetical protein